MIDIDRILTEKEISEEKIQADKDAYDANKKRIAGLSGLYEAEVEALAKNKQAYDDIIAKYYEYTQARRIVKDADFKAAQAGAIFSKEEFEKNIIQIENSLKNGMT